MPRLKRLRNYTSILTMCYFQFFRSIFIAVRSNVWAIISLLIESNKINRLMNHELLIYILSGDSNVQITNKRYEKLFQS
jgi:hypothetical protein